MPLSPPMPRAPLVRRTVIFDGYHREDGMVEIEGSLVDLGRYDVEEGSRAEVQDGLPVHEMHLRLTLDQSLVIVSVECVLDSSPHAACQEIIPNVQRLVGLNVAGGFKKQVRARIGGVAGCTHVLALLEVMAPGAIRTLASMRRGGSRDELLSTFDVRDGGRPALVDSCRAYAADGPIVAKWWPAHYRPSVADEPSE